MDHAKRSFHHSRSEGSELSASSRRSYNSESGNAGRPINSVCSFGSEVCSVLCEVFFVESSREEYHMRDTDSVKKFLESGSK